MKRFGIHSTLVLILIFILITISHSSPGQTQIKDLELERIIEAIFPIQDEELDYDELYQNLYEYYIHPINLNNTQPEVLQSTYLLSPFQINALFQYLEENGPLISVYELQAIPEFDLSTIHKLLPFIKVKESFLKSHPLNLGKSLMKEYNNMLMVRYDRTLETKKGFTEPQLKADSTHTSVYFGN